MLDVSQTYDACFSRCFEISALGLWHVWSLVSRILQCIGVFKTLITRLWLFGVWVVEADDSFFVCLSNAFIFRWRMRISWNSQPWFFVDSDSASSVSVLDLVCVCCWCSLFVFLENHKQHRSWSRIDAMVLLVSLFWKLQWSIAGIRERDSYGMDCFFSPERT